MRTAIGLSTHVFARIGTGEVRPVYCLATPERRVAIAPTFTSVGVLAGIVLIRTFLSFSLEVELTGRWPWQSRVISPPEAAAAIDGD